MIKKLRTQMSDENYQRLKLTFIIILIVACTGIGLRITEKIALNRRTEEQAILTVATMNVAAAPATETIILPGNVQAWHDATIYARTNGYIKKWYVDIGTQVKAGQLLAEIETPELDAQLRQANADLITAQANNTLAQTTAKRWQALLKTDSVSKQETDEKVSAAQANAALVNAALANRDRLQELVGFERVIAPFDGVITSRTTDIGSLINAGSNQQRPLFHLSQVNPLRVYVKIPQNYSSRVVPGMTVELTFAEHPGKKFAATLLDTAQAIDPISRTLLAQFRVENDNDELLPGGYTEVHLKFLSQPNSVRIPVNALLFRAQGLQVGEVDSDSRVHLKSVSISRDYGNVVEINSGLETGTQIIINPSDSLIDGQKVRIVTTAPEKKTENPAHAPADNADDKPISRDESS
jgi:RND family efflux transporter MFP subunit